MRKLLLYKLLNNEHKFVLKTHLIQRILMHIFLYCSVVYCILMHNHKKLFNGSCPPLYTTKSASQKHMYIYVDWFGVGYANPIIFEGKNSFSYPLPSNPHSTAVPNSSTSSQHCR